MKAKWYEQAGPEADVAISTRVRLARNLCNLPFVPSMSPVQREQVINRCLDAARAGGLALSFIDPELKSPLERRAMTERHAISREFEQLPGRRGLLLSDDESISIMINEEDHLRIQCVEPGLRVDECLLRAEGLDDVFLKSLDFAFDGEMGYLTCCPTNLGTGMRISVMLHLDALARNRQMPRVVAGLSQMGLTVRGVWGEGSEAEGNLYQVSNQLTLGPTEEELGEKLKGAVLQLIKRERDLRHAEYKAAPLKAEDGAWRALGILQNARLLKNDEAQSLISRLRVGVGLGIIKNVDLGLLNRLSVESGPATVALNGAGEDAAARDRARAQHIRAALS